MQVSIPAPNAKDGEKSIRRGNLDDKPTVRIRYSNKFIDQPRHRVDRDMFCNANCKYRVKQSSLKGQRKRRSYNSVLNLVQLNPAENRAPLDVQTDSRRTHRRKASEIRTDIKSFPENPDRDRCLLPPAKWLLGDGLVIAKIRKSVFSGAAH